jgi:hypothetical protein
VSREFRLRFFVNSLCKSRGKNLPHVSPAVSMTLVVNSLPVSLTPVEHLELKISSQIFSKNQNEIKEIIRGLREEDS